MCYLFVFSKKGTESFNELWWYTYNSKCSSNTGSTVFLTIFVRDDFGVSENICLGSNSIIMNGSDKPFKINDDLITYIFFLKVFLIQKE